MKNWFGMRVITVTAAILFGMVGLTQAVNYFDGVGGVSDAVNWSDGAVSVPPTLGVITNTVNAWTGNNWGNMGVRQESGYIYDAADNGLYLLNGTVYEIEDSRTDYASYTNLDVSGVFKIWTSTTAPELRLLSGHIEFGTMHLITAPTIDIEDGIFHVKAFTNVNPKANFNFLAGGTGTVVIDDMAGYSVGSVYIDFETGNAGSLTFGQNSGSATPTYSSVTWLVANSRISIDGVADTDVSSYLITQDGDSTTIALNPYRDYDAFVGVGDNPFAPSGALIDAPNWESGVLPSGSTTGILYDTVNVWAGNAWNNLAVRQIGGYVYNAGTQELNLRGGTEGSGIKTIYEIADPRTDCASYTNLHINTRLVLYSQFGEEMELSLLSGHIEANELTMNAPGKGTINMKNGILHVGSLTQAKSTVNMLSGGSGTIVVDSLDTSLNATLYVNFETGNAGSFTFSSKSETNTAAGTWEWLLENTSQISIDGVAASNETDFVITTDGLSTTLSLSPYIDYPKFIGQNADASAPVGALTVDANWEGGVQPTGSSTGLVSVTPNIWLGTAMQNLSVLQVDGTMFAAGAGDFSMRGPSSSSYTCLYLIDDPDTDYASYTNLLVSGEFNLWSQYKNPMELKVFSGHVEAGSINAISGLVVSNDAAQATISMQNGLLHAGVLRGGDGVDRGWFEVNLDMLADGSGQMIFDTLVCTQKTGYLNENFGINFETGNTGSITFGSKLTASGTESAAGIWAAMIANGQLSIDGIVETDSSQFTITQVGNASTIKLSDGSAQTPTEAFNTWISGFVVADTSMTADPDGDGFSNLAEYALYGDPSDAGIQGQGATIAVAADGGTNWFYYVHYERTDKVDAGLSYTPEVGTDLVNTNWSGSGITAVGSGAGPAGFNAVTNRVSMQDEPQQFMRVKIELQD